MPESTIDLILRTKREGDATEQALSDLKELDTGLSDIEKAIAGTRTTIGGLDQDITLFGSNVGTTADLLDGLGVSIPVTPMQLLGQGIQAAGQFAADSLADYSAYVGMIDQMAAFASTSTEEMSALYQVSSQMRVEAGAFEEAMKKLVENGMTPSISQLGALSDEYLALQDPVAQSQFLIETFGEAGQDMAQIMQLGSESIAGMAGELEEWMIVTGKSEEQVEEYQAALKTWDDAWNEVKFNLATNLMPVISDLTNLLVSSSEEVDNSGTKWMNFLPILSGVRDAYILIKNAINDIVLPNLNNAPGYGGARAEGGDMLPHMTYKVGEREIEYINLPFGASVTPASQASGGNISIVYSPMISTLDRTEAVNKLIPIITEANRRR